jgi:hypothetical protein
MKPGTEVFGTRTERDYEYIWANGKRLREGKTVADCKGNKILRED